MNITYIIGNGFDINLGLKTSYQDFYQEYLKKDTPSPVVAEMKSEIAKKQLEKWSDLEIGLGDYTGEMKTREDFMICYSDLSRFLEEYITDIDSKDYSIPEDFLILMEHSITNPELHLNARQRSDFLNLLAKLKLPKEKTVNFLTFNYTHIIERFLNREGQAVAALDNIVHIHKETNSTGIILGVDSIDQIRNEGFRNSSVISSVFLKPIANRDMGDMNDDMAERAL